ncbi:MAG TPA: stalk domain-containing protein [Syntrophomonadaceae bacterium]|nr:stalk domain-containing protein [Syntrophomonadaceae bacterium]
MKTFSRLIGVLLILFCSLSQEVQAAEYQSDITIALNGQILQTDVPPVIQNSRTLVPLRTVAEALKLEVNWNAQTQEIELEGNGVTIKMRIGSNAASKNGSSISLEVPPVIFSNRTMVPVRFISEAMGCHVAWDAAARRVNISSLPVHMEVVGYYALGDAATSSWTDLFSARYPQSTSGNTNLVNELALGWYSMDEEGQLLTQSDSGWQRPDSWSDVLTTAASYKLKTQMCVQMTDDNARIRKMMNNNEARNLAIKNLVAEAAHFDGVNLDFEGLGWNDTPAELSKVRSDYTEFVNDLAVQLHSSGKNLTLTLHALNSAYPGYDYAALGSLADHIIIMAYDYGPKPEPTDMVEQAVKLATADAPAGKLLLGIAVANESASSIASKLAIAEDYNLGGIALWRLGLVADDEWKVLEDNIVRK